MKRNLVFCLFTLSALLLSGCTAQQKEAPDSKSAKETARESQASAASSEQTVRQDTEAADQALTAAANPTNGSETANLTSEQAEEAALSHAGLSRDQTSFMKSKLEFEDGRQIYEVEFYDKDNKEYDYDIDAATGEIISYSHDTHSFAQTDSQNGSAVTAEEAKALALSKVPGAAERDIIEFETDFDHGRTEYEGKIFYDGVEYEFEINGDNGELTNWDVER